MNDGPALRITATLMMKANAVGIRPRYPMASRPVRLGRLGRPSTSSATGSQNNAAKMSELAESAAH